MIAKIQNLSIDNFKNKLSYQEVKIGKTTSEMLSNDFTNVNTFDKRDIYNSFLEFTELNANVKVDYGSEITLNFAHEDNLTDADYLTLAKNYLAKTGRDNFPSCIFKHTDTQHTHLHILISNIDYDGKKFKNSNDRYISQIASRELEHEYRLRNVSSKKTIHQKLSLSEASHRKYYFHNALRQALRNYASKQKLSVLLTNNEIVNFEKGITYSVDELKLKLGSRFDQVGTILSDSKCLDKCLKDELAAKLTLIHKQSKSSSDYISNLAKNDIYFRIIQHKNNSCIVYGLKDLNFYVKDVSLSARFRHDNIFKHDNIVYNNLTDEVLKGICLQERYLSGANFKTFQSAMLSKHSITCFQANDKLVLAYNNDEGKTIYTDSDRIGSVSPLSFSEVANIEATQMQNLEWGGAAKKSRDDDDFTKNKKKKKGLNM
jgi:hypothetical protein